MSRALVLAAVLLSGCVSATDWRPPAPQVRPLRAAAADKGLEVVPVVLERVAAAGRPLAPAQPTDLAFLPGAPHVLLVAQRAGVLAAYDLRSGWKSQVLEVDAGSYLEDGLLGFAVHPDWPRDRRVVTFHVDGESVARLLEWTVAGEEVASLRAAGAPRELLSFDKPFSGHNGGQVRFGPDGLLYAAFGDGGSQRDPERQSQDTKTFSGTMIRVDIDGRDAGKAYAVPADNPFAKTPDAGLPEIYAWGFRNPWRFAFAPDGRLVVADVGQDAIEEIDLVVRGGNYGWSLKEGRACYGSGDRKAECEAACAAGTKLVDPVFTYGRSFGNAIIGGVVVGAGLPGLEGRYLFADNASGGAWALALPPVDQPLADGCAPDAAERVEPPVSALGRLGFGPSAFASGPGGEVLVADVAGGAIWRLRPAP